MNNASPDRRLKIAIGPKMLGWGSWEWVGHGLLQGLAEHFDVEGFAWGELPRCDVAIIVKHFRAVPSRSLDRVPAIIFCPVDVFGSVREIEESSSFLRRCSRIVVHSHRLMRYFEPYASVEYMDHHVSFILPEPASYREDGFVFWAGVRDNVGPLIRWLDQHALPCNLRILTNLEESQSADAPFELRISSDHTIVVENWSRERHIELLTRAKASIDIKGNDFRSAHKPPAKAIDYIASGVPLAMNLSSSSATHLARLGFDVVSPTDAQRWLSHEYWRETRQFGGTLREQLSFTRVMTRFRRLLDDVLSTEFIRPTS